MNFNQVAPAFAEEAKAYELIESIIWPEGPVCPHCGAADKIYKIKPNPEKRVRHGLHKCGHCRKQFTVKVGSIFEDSKLPMSKWVMAIWLMCSSKKGVSANQISRQLDVSYKTAWFICHRVREAMNMPPMRHALGRGGGTVEIDETYIGGKPRNNMRKRSKGRGMANKIAVMTLIERGGDARTIQIPNARGTILKAVARPLVHGTAHIVTDQHRGYIGIDRYFASHGTVDHSKEYVRGILHTNFAESYHSLLKRSIVGTHHHMSAKHLHRYLREREFMWNNRKATDGERTQMAIAQAPGKRLKYYAPKAGRR